MKLSYLFRYIRNRLERLLGIKPAEIYYIGGSDVLPAPLDKADEEQAVRAMEAGDDSARQELIEHNLRLVVYISRRFENTGVGLEDLISIGTIGLIKAVGTFNSGKNIKLATYASRCIENEILMYLRKSSNRRQETSIDEQLNTDCDGNELLLSDILGSEQNQISDDMEQNAEKDVLLKAVNKLSRREKQIMQLRFGLLGGCEHTQKEVADMIGISQSYISRLEKRIIKYLRHEMESSM